jgi:hypothetical protein
MKNKILIPAAILLTLSVFSAYRYYNKGHRNVQREKAIVLSAKELFEAFESDEPSANAMYLDKVIEVNGVISEISSNQEKNTIVILDADNAMGGVACTLENTDGKTFEKKSHISIKGICTGYLTDVVITHGIVVNP